MSEDNSQGVTNWWWVRHAPTGYPSQLIGSSDVPAILPERQALADFARKLPENAIWLVSPRLRCQQTASALRDMTRPGDNDPRTIPEFAEQDFGEWEQLSYDNPVLRDAKDFWNDPGDTVPPAGESFAGMTDRVRTGIKSLNRENDQEAAENIIVVAHAGVIRAAVALALDLDANQALRLQIDPLSLTRIKSFRSDGNAAAHPDNLVTNYWSLQGLNQTTA